MLGVEVLEIRLPGQQVTTFHRHHTKKITTLTGGVRVNGAAYLNSRDRED